MSQILRAVVSCSLQSWCMKAHKHSSISIHIGDWNEVQRFISTVADFCPRTVDALPSSDWREISPQHAKQILDELAPIKKNGHVTRKVLVGDNGAIVDEIVPLNNAENHEFDCVELVVDERGFRAMKHEVELFRSQNFTQEVLKEHVIFQDVDSGKKIYSKSVLIDSDLESESDKYPSCLKFKTVRESMASHKSVLDAILSICSASVKLGCPLRWE